MFGGVNVWRIAVIGKIMYSEWIDFGHKDTICKLSLANCGRLANFPTAKHSRHTVYCTEKTK